MDKKVCITCHKLKELTSFHRKNSSKDGRQSVCKICQNQKLRVSREVKKKEQERPFRMGMTLIQLRKIDYCMMYDFFEQLGYNPSEDIAKQFHEKHNLPYKEREQNNLNKYTYQDCQNEKTPN